MTLILAANLSDRILLACDTLVSRQNKDGTRDVVCYYPKLQQYANVENGKAVRFVSALFAGDLAFARYLAKEIAGAMDQNKLSADIDELRETLLDFLSDVMPKFEGRKKATIIFAGGAYDGSLRMYDFHRLNQIIGPSGFKIEDPVAVQAMQMASGNGVMKKWGGKVPIMYPRQAIFQVRLNEDEQVFEIGDSLGCFQLLVAGSRELNQEQQEEFLRYFLDNRPIEGEGKDIVNYIRNQFSGSIGGGVMLGIIDGRKGAGGMTNVVYDIDRNPDNPSDQDWSFSIEEGRPKVTDSAGNVIDLLQSHFQEIDQEAGLEL